MGGGNLDDKGFTVVELIVSFSLTLVVILLLFQVIISLKELYVKDGLKSELIAKQSIMMQKIMTDFDRNKISQATRCGDDCFRFTFEDGHTSSLTLDRAKGIFHYGDYTTKLMDHSFFGSVTVKNKTSVGVKNGKKDSLITLTIPIYSNHIKGDYGLKVVYQYDSRTTSIGNLNENQEITGKEQILLRGLKEMALLEEETYEEPGYFVKLEDGTSSLNDSRVTITGSVGTALGTYTLTYTLKDTAGNVIHSITRTVSRIRQVYQYDYTGMEQTLKVPVNGIYRIQLWGAAGGSFHGAIGGKGAYTIGQTSLTKNTSIYIYVGEHYDGYKETKSFNGGGHGVHSLKEDSHGANGGGATDIRFVGGAWDNMEGLRSRIMVAAGGAGDDQWGTTIIPGGAGGALAGLPGSNHKNDSCTTNYDVSTGGTQTAGGRGGQGWIDYFGSFGIGGNSPNYLADWNYGSGGGGGYYGGGAGNSSYGVVGSGSGGSSFISGYPGCDAIDSTGKHTNQPNHYSGQVFTNTTMIDGTGSMSNPRGTDMTVGNPSHGYAKITILSITN